MHSGLKVSENLGSDTQHSSGPTELPPQRNIVQEISIIPLRPDVIAMNRTGGADETKALQGTRRSGSLNGQAGRSP
jgi:hypothetical protein